MPDRKPHAEPWTIDFYAPDSGRMVGRVAYDGSGLTVDRVAALVEGMTASEIYARHVKWTDGEVFSVESGQEADYHLDIEAQMREWEEDPIGFADTYGYVPTDDLPADDERHRMRIYIEGYDDDYNPIEGDDPDEEVDDEDPVQVPATPSVVSADQTSQPRVAPEVGGRYRTNTLIPQEYDPSIAPGVLVEVLANRTNGGSDVRVVETGQKFFCPWGNLLPEAE